MLPSIEKLLPGWWRAYRSGWLRADVVAGLIVAAIVIPKALAYATIAGLPVQAGLYTAMVPMAIYAFFGTSRTLSVSTTTTIAILTGAALGQVVPAGQPELLPTAAATLTLMVGGMLVLAGVLRLGFLANFISEPVLVGFKAGIGIVIVVDQLPKLLGLHLPKEGFLAHALSIVQHLPETSLPTLGVAVATIVLLVAIERWWPAIPAPLVAVAAGVGIMAALGLQHQGVSVVGAVPTGLPEFQVPSLQLARDLFADALGIALMSFTETIAAGRAFQRRDEPVPLANRELVATGLATLGGACAGAMPAGGGTSQTAVNTVSGARSPVAGLVTAGMAVACALWLAPVIGAMPNATLAAIVIVYSVGLVEPVEFARILRVRRTEFVWALVAAAGVVLLGTLQGILVAIIVSLAALAYQVTDPPLLILGRKRDTNVFRQQSAEHPDDETFPGALLLRPEGRIFFANAERLAEKMRPLIADPSVNTIILDLRAVPDIEYTALKMLTDAQERLEHLGISLWLVGMNPGVYDVVSRSALGERLGRAGMHFNLEQALLAYQSDRG